MIMKTHSLQRQQRHKNLKSRTLNHIHAALYTRSNYVLQRIDAYKSVHDDEVTKRVESIFAKLGLFA